MELNTKSRGWGRGMGKGRRRGRCRKRKEKKLLSICPTVYATTAANPRESSYACYYDDERQTYLGDWYSVNWMEDSDMVSYVDEVSAFPRMEKSLCFLKIAPLQVL